MHRKDHPPSAFRFDRAAATPESFRFLSQPAQFDKPVAEGAKRKFAGVAYSGDVIEGHWYWDRVVFDLSTTKAPQKLPMLLGHDRDKIVGFSEKVSIGADINVSGLLSSFTEEGKEVAATSDEGFPWQMSVHIEPKSIEEVKPGASVEVNGRMFTGPINVFRNNTIREISFTPTGWDSQTSAVAMAHGTPNTTKESSMTPEEIKALQDKAAKFEADALAEKTAREKAQADAAASDAKVKAFEKEREDARIAKREADIKALFTVAAISYSDATAKPYRTMDEDTFTAVSTQMRDTAKKVDPKLFEEQATNGATGGNPLDAGAMSAKAQELIFAAKQRGQILDVVDAVRQAKTLMSAAA